MCEEKIPPTPLDPTTVLKNINHSDWGLCVCLMVFYATFNNISGISWRSILLVEETGEPVENHRPVASHWQTVVIGTDCIGSCKSNYHTITATTAPHKGLGYWWLKHNSDRWIDEETLKKTDQNCPLSKSFHTTCSSATKLIQNDQHIFADDKCYWRFFVNSF